MVKSIFLMVHPNFPCCFHLKSALVDPASRLLRAGLCARISDRTPQALSQREDDCCLSLLCISVYIYMVGGFNPYENMKVSWDDYSQYMEKYKMFHTTNHIYIDYIEIHIQYLSIYVKQICLELGHMDVYDMHINVNIQCLFYGVIWLKQNLMATVHSC